MGATLVISEQASWMPQSGTFSMTLELIASRLESSHPGLAASLMEASDVSAFPFFNMKALSDEELVAVSQAGAAAYKDIFLNWSAYPDYAHYGFTHLFGELKTMLMLDPRVPKLDEIDGLISFDGKASWKGLGWIYDLWLENLVAWSRTKNENELAGILFEYRQNPDKQANFSALSNSQLQTVFPMIEFMFRYYGDSHDGRGRTSLSVPFLSNFAPAIVELYEGVQRRLRLDTP